MGTSLPNHFINWYERQRAGLGTEFLMELEILYTILQRNPGTYSYYEKPVHRSCAGILQNNCAVMPLIKYSACHQQGSKSISMHLNLSPVSFCDYRQ